MICLVTGGGGFLGSELVRQLIHRGYKVKVLLKECESRLNLEGVNFEAVVGDVRDRNRLEEVCSGVDYVFHAASVYDTTPFYVKYPKELYEINVDGTRNVCEACLKTNVKKLVYTGSTAAIGLRSDRKPSDETVQLNCLKKRSHYEKSKALAQEAALSYQQKGLWVVSVNPSFLIGARDSRPTPTGEVVVNFLNRRYPCYFDATLSLSDVKSAAGAHINALEKGVNGYTYIVANDQSLTLADLFQMLESISGVTAPKLKIPISGLVFFSFLNESLIGVLGLKNKMRPLIAFELARYLTLGCTYDSTKAKREIGFKAYPIEDVLKESVDWFASHSRSK